MEILSDLSRSLGEYLLLPGLTTEDCRPETVSLAAPIGRFESGGEPPFYIEIPVVSAIMQAVSSPRLAVALAQCGGLSFIHHDQTVDAQMAMVSEVKRQKAGFRSPVVHVAPTTTLGDLSSALELEGEDFAIVTVDGEAGSEFLGLISRLDFHVERHASDEPVSSRMRSRDELTCARESSSLSEANSLLWDSRQDIIPVVGTDKSVKSTIHRKDYELHKTFRNECIDDEKRFRVGAGINTHDYKDRVPALLEAEADALCIDSSDGFSVWQAATLDFVKSVDSHVPVGAGNVVDSRGFEYLADAGADFVKVGIGGGSICVTREQKGIGRGQGSALIDVVRARDEYAQRKGTYVPVCCDGGVADDAQIAVALALGADFVMLGRYFARTTESPTRVVSLGGRLYKEYWGEGSERARNWARYEQGDGQKLAFEEGVDGYVPYAGSLFDNVAATVAKLRSTMVSCGSMTLRKFHEDARLVIISEQTRLQSSHDIVVVDGADDSVRELP